MNVVVVILTWKRIPRLKNTLSMLFNQTYKDFKVYISNSNEIKHYTVKNYTDYFNTVMKMNIEASLDSNDNLAFRRMSVGRKLKEEGADVILFIDDDVDFSKDYIKNALSQYEPKSYKSWFAWHMYGPNYYVERTRVYDIKDPVNYVGTGVSMIDANIFLEDGLLNPPEHLWRGARTTEDLWLSYYAQHIMKWKLAYMDLPNTRIHGNDNVALFKTIQQDSYNKADFLQDLIKEGWKI